MRLGQTEMVCLA